MCMYNMYNMYTAESTYFNSLYLWQDCYYPGTHMCSKVICLIVINGCLVLLSSSKSTICRLDVYVVKNAVSVPSEQ